MVHNPLFIPGGLAVAIFENGWLYTYAYPSIHNPRPES